MLLENCMKNCWACLFSLRADNFDKKFTWSPMCFCLSHKYWGGKMFRTKTVEKIDAHTLYPVHNLLSLNSFWDNWIKMFVMSMFPGLHVYQANIVSWTHSQLRKKTQKQQENLYWVNTILKSGLICFILVM